MHIGFSEWTISMISLFFAEIPYIFVRISRLQENCTVCIRKTSCCILQCLELLASHFAQHDKHIAFFKHVKIMLHMQCFALGHVGFQQNQVNFTVQCILRCRHDRYRCGRSTQCIRQNGDGVLTERDSDEKHSHSHSRHVNFHHRSAAV